MGGSTGFALAQHADERIDALIIGGAGPYPAPRVDDDWILETLYQGRDALCCRFGHVLAPALEARLRANDFEALIACRRRRLASRGYADILACMEMPTLLYAGDADPVHAGAKESSKEIPNAAFVSLPGLAHIETMCRADLALPHVEAFLSRLGRDRSCGIDLTAATRSSVAEAA